MAEQLTPRQREVYDYLARCVRERGFPPTIAEIAAHFGMRSPNAAAQHLRLMSQKGAIEIEAGKSRGIRLLLNLPAGGAASEGSDRGGRSRGRARTLSAASARAARTQAESAAGALLRLPVVGRVAAGSPILAEENLDGEVAVDPAAFRPRADYLLRVAGDSMIDAGIHSGDLVAVKRTPDVSNGAIAVVRVGAGAGEVTVKRFERRGTRVVLRPENARLRPLEIDLRVESLTVEGIVVGLVRTEMGAKGRG
ncbi:MAG: transcriptional repressor LexA [Planctomycetes bacterium]|nr:transcriptional repressor LexA [Planctomycetota bacterium]